MTTPRQIHARSEILEADTWDLTLLFETEVEYRTSFAELNDRYSKIAEFKGKLSESADTLLACLEYESRIDQIAERLHHYTDLRNAEDSSDNRNLSRRAELIYSGDSDNSRRTLSKSFRRSEARRLEDLAFEDSSVQAAYAFGA
jgi:oligoendopeptidase F